MFTNSKKDVKSLTRRIFMKISIKNVCSVLVIVALLVGLVGAQSIEEKLSEMASKNAKLYVTPLVTAFGSGMNSGWFHSAKPHKLLGFDIGVRAMLVQVPTDQKTFNFDLSAIEPITKSIPLGVLGTKTITLDPDVIYPDREVPTFFGKDEAAVIEADDEGIVADIKSQLLAQGVAQAVLDQPAIQSNLQSIANNIPDLTPPIIGTDLKSLPLAAPQAAVGLSIPTLPIKAEVVVRALPEIELKDIGKFKFLGFGGKLALDPFIPIPMFPVNISVGAYLQKMSVGKVFETNHSLYTLMVGKDLSLLLFGVGVYGGVGMEKSKVKIKYTYNPENPDPNDPIAPGTQIKFDLTGENKFRTTLGAHIRLTVFDISADYSMGADNVLTAGLGISIR